MELRHLRYFVAVAEMENVSRAALKLHVSQPALSRQIRDLEDEIGFSLLERTAKSVRLTDAGRAFMMFYLQPYRKQTEGDPITPTRPKPRGQKRPASAESPAIPVTVQH